ncbi:MAG: histidine phosphatase family protein [Candidatus Moranbacteria bacterium]|nr:histidine phosphatase family protein [Candidatus Moranbacteria bacterium]
MEQIIFYLVRHGEAENNVRSILSSLPEGREYHLTDKGKEQIGETAAFLKTVSVDALFSSPVCRARESAALIAEMIGRPMVLDERLCETYFGDFNNHPMAEFLKKYPESQLRISTDPKDGVESYIDMRGRLTSFLSDMREKYAGKKVVVVSHGDPLEQLHGILTNEAPGRSATGWYPKKGSCTEMRYDF